MKMQTFPSGADPRGAIVNAFGLFGVPITHFIDEAGSIHMTKVGEITEEELEQRIQAILPPSAVSLGDRNETFRGAIMSRQSRSKPRTNRKKSSWSPAKIGLGVAVIAVAALLALPAIRAGAQGKSVSEFMHLHGLATAPWAPDDVFVSSHQGLMRVDAAGSWTFVSDAPHDFMGFQANPTEEGVLYSSGHPAPNTSLPNPVGFMVSTDQGQSWRIRSLAGQVDFHTMAVQPTNGDVIYGLSRNLMRSTNAGETWETIESQQLARLGDIYALAISPDSADTLLLGTGSGLWRSEDAGRTWMGVFDGAPVTAIAFGQDRIYMYAARPDSGLMSSADTGANWTQHDLFVEGQDAIAYIAPHPTQGGTLTVGSFERNVYRTTDDGQSWTMLAVAGVPPGVTPLTTR